MPNQRLCAPTGHYAVVSSVEYSPEHYVWSVHTRTGVLLRPGELVKSLRTAKTRARRDLEVAAYWPALPPAEMRQAKWENIESTLPPVETLDADALRERAIDLLAAQMVDMARAEIERNFAPVRLADGRFGVRTFEFVAGRVRLLSYKTMDAGEFVQFVRALEAAATGTESVNGALVI